ncbi:hypothetical protein OsI_35791 [Oryza sativa Indica Group]|uniref:Uncharacterized protein n=1 Tax=Oryza sativa subsp. indica TaxID=39946 RepID=A2ZDC8_ORYSI|nr:hypothetical protein OsI_35791 [Oryza sativa Indica Group]
MGFCTYKEKDDIFKLTLTGGNSGHNYLTEKSLKELKETLATIRGKATPSSRGLVTICSGKSSFCDGIDYTSSPPPAVEELIRGMAEVVRELLGMPFPTVAAVGGDVRSSLALALVLAHDDVAVLKKVKIEAREVVEGRHDAVPPYLGALLRDKSSYPQMSSDLVLRSETMAGDRLKYWYLIERVCDDQWELKGHAINMIKEVFGDERDGEAYVTTRKSLVFSECWKAVSELLKNI